MKLEKGQEVIRLGEEEEVWYFQEYIVMPNKWGGGKVKLICVSKECGLIASFYTWEIRIKNKNKPTNNPN